MLPDLGYCFLPCHTCALWTQVDIFWRVWEIRIVMKLKDCRILNIQMQYVHAIDLLYFPVWILESLSTDCSIKAIARNTSPWRELISSDQLCWWARITTMSCQVVSIVTDIMSGGEHSHCYHGQVVSLVTVIKVRRWAQSLLSCQVLSIATDIMSGSDYIHCWLQVVSTVTC